MPRSHYIPAFAKPLGDKALAVCNRYVDYATDSDQPTCEDCRRLIAEEDALQLIHDREVITRILGPKMDLLVKRFHLAVKRP